VRGSRSPVASLDLGLRLGLGLGRAGRLHEAGQEPGALPGLSGARRGGPGPPPPPAPPPPGGGVRLFA
jgi:hypothetical protein